ncbi:hypothetical protein ACLKA7_004545 [Drosophila subpalustris]
MTMRLNLESILQSQMREISESDNNHQNLAAPTEKEKTTLRLGAGKSPADRYFFGKPNVSSRVHSMMASIHQHMKTTAPPRKAVPSVPAAIAEIPVAPSLSKTGSAGKRSRRVKGGTATASMTKSLTMPISKIKARINQQSQQLMRRGFSDLNPKSYTNQRRIREVLLQKTVLENMLLQHKRLQRDRQTIALDIQRMRQDLDKIKNKLDTSLEALKSTRTLYSGFNKGKKGLLPIGLPVNNTAVTISSIARPMAKAATKPAASKSSKIIAKRQHSPSLKKRRSRH